MIAIRDERSGQNSVGICMTVEGQWVVFSWGSFGTLRSGVAVGELWAKALGNEESQAELRRTYIHILRAQSTPSPPGWFSRILQLFRPFLEVEGKTSTLPLSCMSSVTSIDSLNRGGERSEDAVVDCLDTDSVLFCSCRRSLVAIKTDGWMQC